MPKGFDLLYGERYIGNAVIKRHYGWHPQLHDHRDKLFFARASVESIPEYVDLRDKMPPVQDQGSLGSCSAHAIGGAYQFLVPELSPSRLFIYYNERLLEHSTEWDSGANLRDGLKAVAKFGVCPETSWPYDIGDFALKPVAVCYGEALNHQAIIYTAPMPYFDEVAASLARGFPVIFGFTVYESFEGNEIALSGFMPLPLYSERVVGGHAVLAVGYDLVKRLLIIRNSWGDSWGDKGYFYMPEVVFNRYASDPWVIEKIEN